MTTDPQLPTDSSEPSSAKQTDHDGVVRMGERMTRGLTPQTRYDDTRAGTPCGKPLRQPDDAPPVNHTQESTHVPN